MPSSSHKRFHAKLRKLNIEFSSWKFWKYNRNRKTRITSNSFIRIIITKLLMYYLKQSYCNKGVIFLIYTLIFICMLKRSHARFVHITLHNSETLESLTWIRVRPSHRYAFSLSLSLPLSRSHVLYRVYWTSVNIRHSNRSLNLSFRIST